MNKLTISDMHSNACRISPDLQAKLEGQASMELTSSLQYLAMASWCEAQGYDHAAKFLYAQSEEERTHMLKFVSYINNAGGHAKVDTPKSSPVQTFTSLEALFASVLEQEIQVTRSIHELVSLCLENKAYTTFGFLQWFLEEQREEEVWARRVTDIFRLVGKGEMASYFADQEIGKLAN